MASILLALSFQSRATEVVTYYYTNAQGTVLAKTDAQGNVTEVADYRPYGAQALGAPSDGPAYSGHVADIDSGLVYMVARYYDPEIGRFLSIDGKSPESGNIFNTNRFAYSDNEPIGKFDPDGLATEIAMLYHVTDSGFFGYKYGHEFVAMRDTNGGATYVTRAGPSGDYPVSNAISNSQADQNGIFPLSGQPMTLVSLVSDFQNSPESSFQNSVIPDSSVVVDRDFSDVMSQVKAISVAVNNSNIPYRPQTTNSNAYANTVYKSLTGKDAPYQSRFNGPDTKLPFTPPPQPKSQPSPVPAPTPMTCGPGSGACG
ncbi:MAG TPA: RHS repeat-associated core domain-containing protein [Luteibacter sp.]|jgi:RHS repeat-associated protein|nr:RHS repeat-associated core domain-containing protein [Luteibacter sp.]